MASCHVTNAFSTTLKLIWPRSSFKTTKMSKKKQFWQKVSGVNGLRYIILQWRRRMHSHNYEVRSETKLVFRVVESLSRFVSLCTEFVSLTSEIISSWIGPIHLVTDELVSSTPQIVSSWSDLSPPSYSCQLVRLTHHASLLFNSSSAEFVLSNSGIDSSWVDR